MSEKFMCTKAISKSRKSKDIRRWSRMVAISKGKKSAYQVLFCKSNQRDPRETVMGLRGRTS